LFTQFSGEIKTSVRPSILGVPWEITQTVILGAQSIDPTRLSSNFRRALAVGKYDRIIAPGCFQIGLDLFLS
jgi:hypothetical protein